MNFSSQWAWVQQELAKTNRVCAYDRAGHAWSEPGPAPRSPEQIAHELHSLLNAAGAPGPYVLVGQSFGGILVQMYATLYPNEVEGLVLVDSVVLLDQKSDEFGKFMDRLLNQGLGIVFRLGLARPIIAGEVKGYPAQQVAEIKALEPTNQNFDAYYDEAMATRYGGPIAMKDNYGNLPNARQVSIAIRDVIESARTGQWLVR